MSYTSRMKYMPLRTFDTSELTAPYLPLGDPLEFPASIIRIINDSDTAVTISTDGGVTAHDVVIANSFNDYNLTTNRTSSVQGTFIPAGTQFSVSGTAGTGNMYLSALYIEEGHYPFS